MVDLKKELEGYEFSPEGGRAMWYYLHHLLVRSYAVSYKKWPTPWPNPEAVVLGEFKNHNTKWFLVVKSTKVFTDLLNQILKDNELLQKIEDYITDNKERGVSDLKGVKLEKLPDNELKKKLKHYFDHFQYFIFGSANIRRADRAILSVIRNKYEDRSDEFLRMSSILTKPSFAMEEEISLLRLAVEIENGEINEDKKEAELKKIHDTYAWSVIGYHDEKPKTVSYYSEKLDHFVKEGALKILKEIQDKIKADLKERTDYVEKLPKEDKIIADIASRSAYLKDYLKSCINELEYFAEPLFDELERRTKLPKNYTKDLAPTEILELLDWKKVDNNLFDERINHNIIIYIFGEIITLNGREADEFEETYLKVKSSVAKEFKGRIACSGKVTGRVAVVKGHEDFHKVKQGDVLVVLNTSPDYVPILKKVSAIVAEEGGLTAHVSVISREFGIPCLVGIHHITQYLKDDDLVEVDANTGIVKILKRYSDLLAFLSLFIYY